jgi:ABC-type polysaccharide/polyol phosphate export permease
MRGGPTWLRSLGPLVLADLRQRYAGSVLGAAWAVLGPLLEVALYALIFGILLRPAASGDGMSHALFIASGVLPWSALREALEGSASSLTANRWVRRSLVPIDLLVARQVLIAGARGGVGLALVLLVAAAVGVDLGWGAAVPFAALALQTLAAYGVGLALAPAATLHPDLRPALSSAFTVLIFASPIVYPESLVEGGLRRALEWNPFTHLLRLYRLPLPGAGAAPAAGDVLVALALATLLPLAGMTARDRLRFAARDRL